MLILLGLQTAAADQQPGQLQGSAVWLV